MSDWETIAGGMTEPREEETKQVGARLPVSLVLQLDSKAKQMSLELGFTVTRTHLIEASVRKYLEEK